MPAIGYVRKKSIAGIGWAPRRTYVRRGLRINMGSTVGRQRLRSVRPPVRAR